MSQLQITTQIGCLNCCPYCPQDKLLRAYSDRSSHLSMSLENFRTYLKTVPKDVEITFAGMCEPWSNPQCTEMILHAHQKEYEVSVFTTLAGMKESDFDLLESVPLGYVRVHVPSQSGLEKIRTDDCYMALLEKIL